MLRITCGTPNIRKTASYESIFTKSKSLTEEIADALSKRAGSIGRSHPSVIVGREKRLIEGLLDVAEAVRNSQFHKTADEAHSSQLEPLPDSQTLSETQTRTRESNTKDIFGKDQRKPPRFINSAGVNFDHPVQNLIKTSDNAKNSLYHSLTAPYQEVPLSTAFTRHRESTPIHFRLAFGNSDADWSLNRPLESNNRLPRSVINISNAESQYSKTDTATEKIKLRKILSRKRRESIINFIRSKVRTDLKSSPGGCSLIARIRRFLKKERFENLRKRFHLRRPQKMGSVE